MVFIIVGLLVLARALLIAFQGFSDSNKVTDPFSGVQHLRLIRRFAVEARVEPVVSEEERYFR
jgi:hypothetical protein